MTDNKLILKGTKYDKSFQGPIFLLYPTKLTIPNKKTYNLINIDKYEELFKDTNFLANNAKIVSKKNLITALTQPDISIKVEKEIVIANKQLIVLISKDEEGLFSLLDNPKVKIHEVGLSLSDNQKVEIDEEAEEAEKAVIAVVAEDSLSLLDNPNFISYFHNLINLINKNDLNRSYILNNICIFDLRLNYLTMRLLSSEIDNIILSRDKIHEMSNYLKNKDKYRDVAYLKRNIDTKKYIYYWEIDKYIQTINQNDAINSNIIKKILEFFKITSYGGISVGDESQNQIQKKILKYFLINPEYGHIILNSKKLMTIYEKNELYINIPYENWRLIALRFLYCQEQPMENIDIDIKKRKYILDTSNYDNVKVNNNEYLFDNHPWNLTSIKYIPNDDTPTNQLKDNCNFSHLYNFVLPYYIKGIRGINTIEIVKQRLELYAPNIFTEDFPWNYTFKITTAFTPEPKPLPPSKSNASTIKQNININTIKTKIKAVLTGSTITFITCKNPLEKAYKDITHFMKNCYPTLDDTLKDEKETNPENTNKNTIFQAREELYNNLKSDIDIMVQIPNIDNIENTYHTEKYYQNIAFDEYAQHLFTHIKKSTNNPNLKLVKVDVGDIYRYEIKGYSRNIQIFYVNDIPKTITSFHLGIVRAWYDGSKVKCLPSFLMSAMTGINPDIRWCSSTKKARDILLKYAIRGFGTYTNEADTSEMEIYIKTHPYFRHHQILKASTKSQTATDYSLNDNIPFSALFSNNCENFYHISNKIEFNPENLLFINPTSIKSINYYHSQAFQTPKIRSIDNHDKLEIL